MDDDAPGSDEGSSPVDDIKKQNPDGTTTGDQTGEANDDASDAGSDDSRKLEHLPEAEREGADAHDRSR